MINNLYPPIIETYQPAFVIKKESFKIKVYFNISILNSIAEIKHAQVIISNQKNNQNILNTSMYPTGIKICQIYKDTDSISKNRFYIEINSLDIQGGFQINQYYKIQIRFSKIEAPSSTTNIDAWLTQNLESFSEWSSISLLHGISEPILKISYKENQKNIITQSTLNIIASLSFNNPNEKEYLKSYQLFLYAQNGELIERSNIIYSNQNQSINQINYIFKHILEDKNNYQLKINITTNNLYQNSYNYLLYLEQKDTENIPAQLIATPYKDLGMISIILKGLTQDPFSSSVILRRTDNKTDFLIWEDLNEIEISQTPLLYSWYDNLIESGTWYKYGVQRIDEFGNRGPLLQLEKPVMCLFEDMYIVGEKDNFSNFIRIKYNPQISSYKRFINETKIETLGSKFPFIRRQGNTDYRQFSISGLISFHSDIDCETSVNIDSVKIGAKTQNSYARFLKEQVYGGEVNAELYESYNKKEGIGHYNDFILEREYRQQVIDFLYSDSVKLIKTLPEGNILVRLMDINLEPEPTLGRMLYSFSATAYEVDNYSIENCLKYNIMGVLDE